MSPVESDFLFVDPSPRTTVRLADDYVVPCLGEGTVLLPGVSGPVHLTHVLLVPALGIRLISVPAIYDHEGHVVWGSHVTELHGAGQTGPLVECARRGNGWYAPAYAAPQTSAPPATSHCLLCEGVVAATGSGPESVPASAEIWHARLGHVNPQTLESMRRHHWVVGLEIKGSVPKSHVCPACLRGKMTQRPFPSAPSYRATAPFERVHMDLMGKI